MAIWQINPMERALLFARKLNALNRVVARAAVWLIPALMLVLITDITLRRWFVIGSIRLQELEWHLHGALFLLTLGWAYGKNAHVRIELFSEKLSPRTQALIEIIGCLFFLLPYCGAVLWFGYDYTAFSYTYSEASASPNGLPARWIIKSFILVGFALLALSAIAKLIESIAAFQQGPKATDMPQHATSMPQKRVQMPQMSQSGHTPTGEV